MNIISEVDMLCTKRFFVRVVYSFMAFVMTLGSGLSNFLVENIAEAAELALPAPDQILNVSNDFSYPILRGVKFNPQDPLNLEFIFDSHSKDIVNKEDANQLIEFFVAGLSIAEEDMWVNLSPYESQRVIPEVLSNTALGRDMLAQDYFLKQLSSSLTSPNGEYGAEYWEKVLASKNLSATDVDAFNKIWIVPGEAQLQDAETEAFIDFAQLDVMTEQDYMAMEKNSAGDKSVKTDALEKAILPVIKNEINNGKNFSRLRQIHYSLILASWFKKKFANTFYKDYFNSKSVEGIDINGKESKIEIYNQYVEAFKKGVYKIEKKERNDQGRIVKRQYMSGGVTERELTQKTNVKNVSEIDKDFEGQGFMCSGVFLQDARIAFSTLKDKWHEMNAKGKFNKLLKEPDLYNSMSREYLKLLDHLPAEFVEDNYQSVKTLYQNAEGNLKKYLVYIMLHTGESPTIEMLKEFTDFYKQNESYINLKKFKMNYTDEIKEYFNDNVDELFKIEGKSYDQLEFDAMLIGLFTIEGIYTDTMQLKEFYKALYSNAATRAIADELKIHMAEANMDESDFMSAKDYALALGVNNLPYSQHLVTSHYISFKLYYDEYNIPFDFDFWNSVLNVIRGENINSSSSFLDKYFSENYSLDSEKVDITLKLFVDLLMFMDNDKFDALYYYLTNSKGSLKEMLDARKLDREFSAEGLAFMLENQYDYNEHIDAYLERVNANVINYLQGTWGANYRTESVGYAVAAASISAMAGNSDFHLRMATTTNMPKDVIISMMTSKRKTKLIDELLMPMEAVSSYEVASNQYGGVSMKSLLLQNVNTYKGSVANVNVDNLSTAYKISIADLQKI